MSAIKERFHQNSPVMHEYVPNALQVVGSSSRPISAELGDLPVRFDHNDAERGSETCQDHQARHSTQRSRLLGVGAPSFAEHSRSSSGSSHTLERKTNGNCNITTARHNSNNIAERRNGKSSDSDSQSVPPAHIVGFSTLTDDNRHTHTFTGRPRTLSPDDYRRSTSSSTRQWLNRVPEDSEMDIESGSAANMAAAAIVTADLGPEPHNHGHVYYGTLGTGPDGTAGYLGDASLEIDEECDSISEEEEEWLLDEALAREGLYRGNYKNLMLLYTLVPLSTLLAFVILALLPVFAFPRTPESPFPYPPYLPFPLPELLTAAALWSLSYLLRDFLYAFSLFFTSLVPFPTQRFPSFIAILTSVFSESFQSASALLFRQLAIPILLIPFYSTEYLGLLQFLPGEKGEHIHKHHFPTWQDGAFRRVWWVALGWAAAEAVVGIKQGYESIGLYKDVLVSVRKSDGREEMMTAVAAVSGAGVRREAQSGRDVNKDASANGRLETLVQRQQKASVENDSDVTPTQRNWDGSRQRVSTDGEIQAPLRTREHSRSLSSSNSGGGYRAVYDLSGSSVLGERQPLLTLNLNSSADGNGVSTATESERLLVENEVEQDLDELIRIKNREELEEVYGIPVIRIPVFISCLHRINAILSSLGVTLLLTAAYMRSTLAYFPPPAPPSAPRPFSASSFSSYLLSSFQHTVQPSPSSPDFHPFRPCNRALLITFPVLLLVQTILSLMHTPWILPRIGIHTFVYVGLLIWLGVFFGGLGIWEVLT